jgi:hypothetical protein
MATKKLKLKEVFVKCRGRVIFRQYIPKKTNHFCIKIYKLCDEAWYLCAVRLYVGKHSHSTTDDMTATQAAVRHLTGRAEGLIHKLFMDNCFSSPRLFDESDTK